MKVLNEFMVAYDDFINQIEKIIFKNDESLTKNNENNNHDDNFQNHDNKKDAKKTLKLDVLKIKELIQYHINKQKDKMND